MQIYIPLNYVYYGFNIIIYIYILFLQYPDVINPILDSIHNIGERCKTLFNGEKSEEEIVKELKVI